MSTKEKIRKEGGRLMITSEQETLWGVVEEIIYHNDDNDYTVMEIINKEEFFRENMKKRLIGLQI